MPLILSIHLYYDARSSMIIPIHMSMVHVTVDSSMGMMITGDSPMGRGS